MATDEVDDGIRSFWKWWATGRDRVLRAIEVEGKFSEELIADISYYVNGVGTDLDWELCAGKSSKHAICLSAKGDSEGRLITESWRVRGPAPDETWEYFAARQAHPHRAIELDHVRLDADDLKVIFEVDTLRARICGTYTHPRFAELSEKMRTTALFLLLDGVLGEDGVERWLGGIEATADRPDGAVPLSILLAAIADLEQSVAPTNAILKAETEAGELVIVSCNMALKRIDYLLHTTHLAIDLAILDQNPQGLTTDADSDALETIQDELEQELQGLVAYFGRETRPGHRVMHWYIAEDSAAQPIVERWAARHADRSPQIAWIRDPMWEFVKRYV